MRLADKSIVVTGATGIAAAGARAMAAEGASIFVVSLEESDCQRLVSEIEADGGSAGWARADLTVESESKAAIDSARDRLGRIDGLFAVAGGSGRRFGDGPAHGMGLEAWVKTLEHNTVPMFLATSQVIGQMREEGGSVVVVSSVLATRPSPELFATHAYAAAKGAANSYVTSRPTTPPTG
jgi:NAD(P)-dependent dehydrogenase (short-subunit alcohol dehydrogenase family)